MSIVESDVSKVVWTSEKARLLSKWKEESGASIRDIANAGDYSRSSIPLILDGTWKEVDYESIKAIAVYLGHSYEELGGVVKTEIPENRNDH